MEKLILFSFEFFAALLLFFFSNPFSTSPNFYHTVTFSANNKKLINDKNVKKPIILEWNKYWEDISYANYSCANQCIFTTNQSFENVSTLITFHYPSLNLFDLPKSKNLNRMNVFVSFESPANYPYSSNLTDDFFNATISYMLNSDYPMVYNCFKKLGKNDEDRWSEKQINEILIKKTKPILTFVSNCNTTSKRELLIPILEKYISVTKYGNCFKTQCQRNTKCEKDEQEKHFFILALENSHCIDYFTEKVWKLRNLIVPIIWDRKLLRGKLAYLNPYVIALCDFKNIKEFAEYLKYLMNNKKEYRK